MRACLNIRNDMSDIEDTKPEADEQTESKEDIDSTQPVTDVEPKEQEKPAEVSEPNELDLPTELPEPAEADGAEDGIEEADAELLPAETETEPHEPSAIDRFFTDHGIPRDLAVGVMQGAVAVLLGIVLVLTFVSYRARTAKKQEQASMHLLQATSAGTVEEVIEKYSSKDIKPLAILKLAQMQYSENNFALSLGTYEKFIATYGDHPLLPTAKLGRIICTESQGQLDAALNGYSLFLTEHADSFVAPEAVFGRARCLRQLRRLEEAKQVYDEFMVDEPDSVWAGRAAKELEILELEIRRKNNK
jgi:tetratricopeptide (TPR) repeat protein